MRILITVPWAQRLGGAEAMLQGILSSPEEHEHELEVIFFEEGPWAEELREAGLRVEVVRAGRLRQAHRWAATVIRLSRLFGERDPDLILNWSAKTQLYGSPAAVLAGMSDRVVWWQHAFPGKTWLDKTATLLPAAAVGCTSRAAGRAQERLFPKRRTFAVAAGCPPPPEDPVPADIDLPSDVPIVGLVGRLQPWKGQDRLLRAQRILHDRGREMHLVIIGGDSWGLSADYAASLAPLAAELGLSEQVTMTGEVPDAGPYIERLDVLVNASDQEPFGIVILEGMARGVAVLAVNSGGPAEFVQEGVTGLLARSGEPEALADALEPLLLSPELRGELGAEGRKRFAEEFTTAALRARFFARMAEIARDR